MAKRREVREDQHGTLTGYAYGCRCDPCRSKRRLASRAYYADTGKRVALEYRKANPDVVARNYRQRMRSQSASVADATRQWSRWEPHEDALLTRIPSNIAAAGALGRTIVSIQSRRRRLGAKAC